MTTAAEKPKRLCKECEKLKSIGALNLDELCPRCVRNEEIRRRAEAREAAEQAFHQVEPGKHTIHDIAKGVADSVIKLLEQGHLPPWRQGWRNAAPQHNGQSGYIYNGMNRWETSARAIENGWESSAWLTAHQIYRMGGHIRPDEHSTVIWLAIPPFRAFYVFNVEQTTGCRHGSRCRCSRCVHQPSASDRIQQAEEIIENMPNRPRIIHEPTLDWAPHYSPDYDRIATPPLQNFDQSEEYYSTLFHELTHSTAHENRVGRDTSGYGENIHERAEEELIAEMGAAILCNQAGIGTEALANQAAYIEHWKERLRQPDGAWVIRQATAQAEKAVKYIIGARDGDEPAEAVKTRQ